MARSFNGTSDFGSAAINLSSVLHMTACFWGINVTNGTGDKMFLEYTANSSGSSSSGGFFIDPNSGGFAGNVEIFVRTSSDLFLQADKTFPQPSANAWHHWAVEFNLGNPLTGAGKIAAAYVDGVAQTLTDHTTTGLGGAFANSTLYAGSRGGASLFNACSIADLALFCSATRGLTPLEVLALARGARPYEVGQDTTLHWWPLDGLVAPEPDLISAGGVNLALTGTALAFGPPMGPQHRLRK